MIELEIAFAEPDSSDRFLGDGWGATVPYGRWMTGSRSTMVLPPPPRRCAHLDVRAIVGPFWATGRVPNQKLAIRVGGIVVHEHTLDNMADLRFRIPGELAPVDRALEFEFAHPDPIDEQNPEGLGQALALSIWKMTIVGHGDDIPGETRFPPGTPSIFHVRSGGNIGNRMIQFMLALSVSRRAENCAMSGVLVPEWGLVSGNHVHDWCDLYIDEEQHIDLFSVTQFLSTHPGGKAVYRGYGQRMENFLPLETYRSIFKPTDSTAPAFGERYLVINVRAGDVVAGQFVDYVLIPVAFYRDLINRTGLTPVFMGQLAPDPYTDMLRAAFPTALFLESQGQMWDFEVIRRATNVVTSVSTFSWIAAWLSDAKRIYMPVNGLLNPEQYPKVDLLPIGDPRYVFYLFPVNKAVPPEELAAAHAALDGRWCEVSHNMLNEIRMRAGS